MLAIVTGAGGFIGGHLSKRLIEDGYNVVATDIKDLDAWDQKHGDAVSVPGLDLRVQNDCMKLVNAFDQADRVFNLAADMGGMGYIETHKAACMLSVLISTNISNMACRAKVGRYFYSSSACVYAADKQTDTDITALKEEDAYPAMPEDGYGWEKLFSERMCRHLSEDWGLTTRVARFHNVYGPLGEWRGGREKAPAAICRKVVEAKLSGNHEIDIWGDGKQTRSFMFIDDCVNGILKITESDIDYPINLGSSELVSVDQLVSMVEDIAGIKLNRTYNLDAPKGVRGRNSDNTLILKELDWEPSIPLRTGMEKLYQWIYDNMIQEA